MLALNYSANVIPLNPRRQEDTILSLPRSKEHWTLRTVWPTQRVHEQSIFWAFAQLFFLHTWILKQVVHFESFHSIFESIDLHGYFKTFRVSILFFIVPLAFFFSVQQCSGAKFLPLYFSTILVNLNFFSAISLVSRPAILFFGLFLMIALANIFSYLYDNIWFLRKSLLFLVIFLFTLGPCCFLCSAWLYSFTW